MIQVTAQTPALAALLAEFLRLDGHIALWLAECVTITTAPLARVNLACDALHTTFATR